jgi:hypothetical protein
LRETILEQYSKEVKNAYSVLGAILERRGCEPRVKDSDSLLVRQVIVLSQILRAAQDDRAGPEVGEDV